MSKKSVIIYTVTVRKPALEEQKTLCIQLFYTNAESRLLVLLP